MNDTDTEVNLNLNIEIPNNDDSVAVREASFPNWIEIDTQRNSRRLPDYGVLPYTMSTDEYFSNLEKYQDDSIFNVDLCIPSLTQFADDYNLSKCVNIKHITSLIMGLTNSYIADDTKENIRYIYEKLNTLQYILMSLLSVIISNRSLISTGTYSYDANIDREILDLRSTLNKNIIDVYDVKKFLGLIPQVKEKDKDSEEAILPY